MISIQNIAQVLEAYAPPALQESYDNVGLLIGNKTDVCTGVLICLDVTLDVLNEAKAQNINLIVAHHPVIFSGIKKINGKSSTEKIIIEAIKNNIAIYAYHTNLDNVLNGVSGYMASLLGLQNLQVLTPKTNTLKQLAVYVPPAHKDALLQALFNSGAGNISNYSECSFTGTGTGTFMPNEHANPQTGDKLIRNTVEENRIEVLYEFYKESQILAAMQAAHPYEEIAYQTYNLSNNNQNFGSGVVGSFKEPIAEHTFLALVQKTFHAKAIKHTALLQKPISKVAYCGGSGSFLIKDAIQAKADAFITADIKYHDYFTAENKILLVDIGHYESEAQSIGLIYDILSNNFPNFAIQKSKVNTNPVQIWT